MISLVTTEPAPMTTSSAILTGMMVAFDPIDTRLPITVSRHSSFCPLAGPPIAKVSLMNITPWPMKQSSPMVTSSQMKACDCTRERAPTFAPFWISVKGPTKQSSDAAAVEIAGLHHLCPRAEADVADAGLEQFGPAHDTTP